MTPFVLIDHMSLIHPLAHKIKTLPPSSIPQIVAKWVQFFSHPVSFLPETNLGKPYEFRSILVSDLKASSKELGFGESEDKRHYWRHEFFLRYKSGRAPHNQLLKTLRDETIEQWKNSGHPFYMAPGFEADDFASAFCRKYPETPKYLMTVDSDWAGLIDETTYWLDTYAGNGKRLHNILDSERMLDRFNEHKDYKGKTLLTKPSDIYLHKQLYGDVCDSIHSTDDVPIGIIDLVDPLKKVEFDEPVFPNHSPIDFDLRCDMFGLPNFHN